MKLLVINAKDLISTSYNKDGHVIIKTKAKSYNIIDWRNLLVRLLNQGLTKETAQKVKTLFLIPSGAVE